MADFQIGLSFIKGNRAVIRTVKLPGAARLYGTRDANGFITLPSLPNGTDYVNFQAVTSASFNVSDNNQTFRLIGDDGWSDSVITGSELRASMQTYFQKDVSSDASTLVLGAWGGVITAGSLYTDGTYLNVPLEATPSTGRGGALANITVASGAVTSVVIVSGGSGYQVGDTLTAAAANLGGSGSGFSLAVTAPRLGSGPVFRGAYDEAFDLIQESRYNKELEFYFEFLKEMGQVNDGSPDSNKWFYDFAGVNGVIMNYNESQNPDGLTEVSFDVMSRGRPVFGKYLSDTRLSVSTVQ